MSEIKSKVRDRYAAAALGSGCCESAESAPASGCCAGPSHSSTPLGCGIPLRHAQLQAGERVLDLGSGPGLELLAAAKLVGPSGRVIGVDMTPEMVEAARLRAAEKGAGNVEFLLGDIEALPLADQSTDVIISNCVINLAPDKARVFREMFRVLKSGGRFSVSDMVTHGTIPPSLRANTELWAECVAGAVEEQTYLDLIRQAGFVEVQVRDQVQYGALPSEKRDQNSACTLWSVTVTAVKPPSAAN
jgi:arsenite methyltransferase